MIIFQTAGGGDAGAFGLKGGLLDARPPATTFRSNAYIHRLNRTLQAEECAPFRRTGRSRTGRPWMR